MPQPRRWCSSRPRPISSRYAQGFQLACILRHALLHEPQPIAKHFAGIVVPAGLDEGLEEFFLRWRLTGIAKLAVFSPESDKGAQWLSQPRSVDVCSLCFRRADRRCRIAGRYFVGEPDGLWQQFYCGRSV